MRSLIPLASIGMLALLGLGALACATAPPPGEEEDGGVEQITLCTGPGPSYGIMDFPCPATTVEGWVSASNRDDADGGRTHTHAWYLFAGLHQVQPNGSFLWRTWPTSTQAFPGQFDTASNVGVEPMDLLSLPGSKLEHPTPTTPRFADVSVDPGVDAQNLSLPGGPNYAVPNQVLSNPRYQQCIRTTGGVPNLIDGPTLQNNGDVMVAGVIYSPDAASWIRNQRLWNATLLDGQLPALKTAPPSHATMPENSIALKPQMWPVRGDGYTPLPLYDNPPPDADQIDGGACEIYSGFERQALWQRAVAMTTKVGGSETTVTASYLMDPSVQLAQPPFDPTTCQPAGYRAQTITYHNIPVVGLDRFYTIRYSEAELDAMNPCDRALLDQSAIWSYGRPFAATDALVLIAMHIMTKEQPGWTFQSAWWYDQAWSCPTGDSREAQQCRRFAKHRPTDIPGSKAWQNYLMTSTYGIPQIPGQDNFWPPNGTSQTTWPVAFNPYIELAATHPIETNCINCHRRAAWPSRLKKSKRFPDRTSDYLLTGTNVPGLLDEFEDDNPIFNGLLTLDSMWAISDRAYYPPPPADDGAGE